MMANNKFRRRVSWIRTLNIACCSSFIAPQSVLVSIHRRGVTFRTAKETLCTLSTLCVDCAHGWRKKKPNRRASFPQWKEPVISFTVQHQLAKRPNCLHLLFTYGMKNLNEIAWNDWNDERNIHLLVSSFKAFFMHALHAVECFSEAIKLCFYRHDSQVILRGIVLEIS